MIDTQMTKTILDDFAFMRNGKQVKPLTLADAKLLKAIEPEPPASNHAMLLIHGFTSTPGVFREMQKALAQKGYALHCPVLPGHSTSIEDFSQCQYQQWQQTIEQTYTTLSHHYEKISVLGLSLGGLLAYQLAQKHPIERLYLLAPCLGIHPPLSLASAVLRLAKLFGLKQLNAIGGNIRSGDLAELTYKKIPISALLQLFAIMKTTKFSSLDCPTNVFFGRYDKAVSNRKSRRYFDNKAIIHELANSAHVLPLDGDLDQILATIPRA